MNTIKIKKINKRNDILIERFIFFRCSGFIASSIGKAVSLTNVTTKTVNDENIDEIEEYLNISETTIHAKINKNPNCADNANKTPKYVATPFPPLNLSQIGKR